LALFSGKIAMPTYEYVCEKCDHKFDHFQSIKEEPIKVCPREKCGMKKWGKGKVRRAIGAGAGLIFKGSGFYITDYRSEGYKAAAKKESGGGESKAGGETKAAPAKKESSGTSSSSGSKSEKK
jgi:putative FmdB family regulatory protein